MTRPEPDARYLPLAAILKSRGLRVSFNSKLNRDIHSSDRFKELTLQAPCVVCHATKGRRLVIGLGNGLEPWRSRLAQRGISLLEVTPDGLTSNAEGIADLVSHILYKVEPDELKGMLQKGMPLAAIASVTGLSTSGIVDKLRFYFNRPLEELRCSESSAPASSA